MHRVDAGRLYRLALEHGGGEPVFHGVAEEGIAFREIAEVIGRRLKLPFVKVLHSALTTSNVSVVAGTPIWGREVGPVWLKEALARPIAEATPASRLQQADLHRAPAWVPSSARELHQRLGHAAERQLEDACDEQQHQRQRIVCGQCKASQRHAPQHGQY